MSHLRMLMVSAATALAIAIVGPLLMGATPVSADGPHMTHMQSVNPNTVVVIHHHRHVQIPFRVVQPVAVFHPVVVAQPVVVAPVSVVQPVMVAQPVVVTVTPSFPAIIVTAPYPWSSYGPNWNAGWTLAQTQQLCQSYVQTVQTNPTAFNQYVQAICVGSSSTPY